MQPSNKLLSQIFPFHGRWKYVDCIPQVLGPKNEIVMFFDKDFQYSNHIVFQFREQKYMHLVIWWAMRKLGIEEWSVRFVQAMYNNTRSRVRVNNTYSDKFGVKLEFTRVRYLALSYLSLYSKLYLASSALGYPGSCCMLMT